MFKLWHAFIPKCGHFTSPSNNHLLVDLEVNDSVEVEHRYIQLCSCLKDILLVQGAGDKNFFCDILYPSSEYLNVKERILK